MHFLEHCWPTMNIFFFPVHILNVVVLKSLKFRLDFQRVINEVGICTSGKYPGTIINIGSIQLVLPFVKPRSQGDLLDIKMQIKTRWFDPLLIIVSGYYLSGPIYPANLRPYSILCIRVGFLRELQKLRPIHNWILNRASDHNIMKDWWRREEARLLDQNSLIRTVKNIPPPRFFFL